jgi:hypothetical protein
MRRMRRGASALVLWGALAACGALVGSLTATGALAATDPSSVRITTSGSLSVPSVGSAPVHVNASGALDFVTHTATITLHVPGNLAATFPGGSDRPTTVKVLMVKAVVYLSYPGLPSATGGKSWIAITEGTPASEATLYQFVAEILGDLPTQLRAEPATEVHKLGTSVVGGVKTTGYMVVERQGTGSLVRRWYWADANERLVRIRVQTQPAKGPPLTGTTNFSGYGAPVVVAAPAASETKAEPGSVLEKYLSIVDGIIELVF